MHCLIVTYPAPNDAARFKANVPNDSSDGATIFHFAAGA
jgi:hypothetical protein